MPVKNSRRAAQTLTLFLMLVTYTVILTTSAIEPPAASSRPLILPKITLACSYSSIPASAFTSSPRATMPET